MVGAAAPLFANWNLFPEAQATVKLFSTLKDIVWTWKGVPTMLLVDVTAPALACEKFSAVVTPLTGPTAPNQFAAEAGFQLLPGAVPFPTHVYVVSAKADDANEPSATAAPAAKGSMRKRVRT